MNDEKCCKNCRHWDEFSKYSDTYGKSGGSINADAGHCRLATSTNGEPDVPESIAVTLDLESYSSYLITMPHFYCNQWEEK